MKLNPQLAIAIATSLPYEAADDSRSQEERVYDTGYRDALESLLLALEADGVAFDTLNNALQTAMDAHANNA